VARLILDTNMLVAMERGRSGSTVVSGADDIAIASITLAEFGHGVLAADPARRPRREQFLEDLQQAMDVLPYTRATAAEHAVLLDHVRRTGRPRGAHDLIIAAHARQTGRRIATLDAKARFGDLPGVDIHAAAYPTDEPPPMA
jgi:tRNA(fMet)-specific endonuclease VapC